MQAECVPRDGRTSICLGDSCPVPELEGTLRARSSTRTMAAALATSAAATTTARSRERRVLGADPVALDAFSIRAPV
jgi:hypothetical protein